MYLIDGRTYKNRQGKLITVTLTHPKATYPFTGSNRQTFTIYGKHCRNMATALQSYDLIEEVPQQEENPNANVSI